jgi:hypothetical protein
MLDMSKITDIIWTEYIVFCLNLEQYGPIQESVGGPCPCRRTGAVGPRDSMRIRYSIVIPVLFGLFLLFLIILLIVAEQEKARKEQESQNDSGVVQLLNQEQQVVDARLKEIQSALRILHLGPALECFDDIEGALATMRDSVERFSETNREKGRKVVDGLTEKIMALKALLQKGDIPGAAEAVAAILEKK